MFVLFASLLAPSVSLLVCYSFHVFSPQPLVMSRGLERPITAQHPGVSCATATLGVSPGWRSATPGACAAQGASHPRAAGRPWRTTDLPNLISKSMIWCWISHTHIYTVINYTTLMICHDIPWLCHDADVGQVILVRRRRAGAPAHPCGGSRPWRRRP